MENASEMNKMELIIDGLNESYRSKDGVWEMRRDFDGTSPNGNAFNGRWVLTRSGEYVDYDQYRYDLAERYNLDLG